MQYVRSVASAVSKTYSSINPATLSGAIDVIVVEQEDGSLACSPFHVRFGKFQLLRPSDKKVTFCVNGEKQDFAMKLGDGGEAFFVFETQHDIPPSMQTSPLVSPAASPDTIKPVRPALSNEPSFLDLGRERAATPDLEKGALPALRHERSNLSDHGVYPASRPPGEPTPASWSSDGVATPATMSAPLARAASEEFLSPLDQENLDRVQRDSSLLPDSVSETGSTAPASISSAPGERPKDAYDRALTLSKKLSTSNIRSKVTESGDLMLDMTGYKSSEDQALRAEALARKLLSEELEGNYDIGSLIGTDEHGNLWIYSSEEAKDAANRRVQQNSMASTSIISSSDSDPGYHSDSDQSTSHPVAGHTHTRARSEELPPGRLLSEPSHFAKTLRLTSDQLKKLHLHAGANPISFTVNKSTCQAVMYLWRHDTPIVISDIDGTITKSDVWGHVYNTIGKDWTHAGVAKLYTDIVANGYNIFYLTSRSVGQADMTRNYLYSIDQDGYKMPKGPVIMSPDRTIAALRREVYLRKPEVFKMACLRDILSLFPGRSNPFYAGFGNRLTDALSYRTVHIPSSRIFTINSKAEVSLDLLSLTSYKSSYVSMQDLVDHSFPPTSTLVKEGGEDYTDFKYWRDDPAHDLDGFQPSDSEDDSDEDRDDHARSYLARAATAARPDLRLEDSVIRESIEVDDDVDVNRLRIVDSIQSYAVTDPTGVQNVDDDGDDKDYESDSDDDYVNDYVDSGRNRNSTRR